MDWVSITASGLGEVERVFEFAGGAGVAELLPGGELLLGGGR